MSRKPKPIAFEVSGSGCFLVTSHKKTELSYVQTTIAGDRQYLHRRIYEEMFGTIPPGLVIRHACDNGYCINPEHLSTGTNAENVQDRQDRNRQAKGEKIHTCLLDETKVLEIVELFGLASDSWIGKMYSVSKWTIRDIRHGRTWTHLTDIPKRGRAS